MDLFPHQKEALAYAKHTPNPAFLMEMRLGKTRTAIMWASKKPGAKLVICPLSVVASWEKELKEFGIVSFECVGKYREDIYVDDSAWIITNYETLLTKYGNPLLHFRKPQTVIVDESTRIKNPTAKITKALTTWFQEIPNRAILTGKPAPESLMDYYSQFQFLNGSFLGFKNFWAFRSALFLPISGIHKWVPKSGTKERIINEVKRLSFIRTRKQVGLGNQKIYESRTVEMDPEQRKLYRKAEKEFALQTPQGDKLTTLAITRLLWMSRIAGGWNGDRVKFHPKINELVTLLKGELQGEQVVIWFKFNSEIEAVLSNINDACVITGSTPLEGRKSRLKMFQSGECQYLLMQQKVGMYGLDLSAASTAIYYSNGFSYENRIQSEDRIEHPKKREPLLIVDLLCKDSVDEYVLKALRRKGRQADILFNVAEDVRRKYEKAPDTLHRPVHRQHRLRPF